MKLPKWTKKYCSSISKWSTEKGQSFQSFFMTILEYRFHYWRSRSWGNFTMKFFLAQFILRTFLLPTNAFSSIILVSCERKSSKIKPILKVRSKNLSPPGLHCLILTQPDSTEMKILTVKHKKLSYCDDI